MNRRHFMAALAAATSAPAADSGIARIRVTPVEGRFHKFVAMNAYDTAPKGRTYSNHLIRIVTGGGVEGVGVMGYRAPDQAFYGALKTLAGVDPRSLYRFENGFVTGRAPAHAAMLRSYPFLDGAFFDLIGKLTGKAAWRLIGPAARERVEAYDGTLYFSDIAFPGRGVKAVVEEAKEAVQAGYRGIKVKLGRGWRWMEPEAGFRRDVEVVHAVRAAVGPKVRLMVDPNNGYRNQPERAWQLLRETAADNLYWLEEPYPEDVARYAGLRAKMRQAGIRTLIADGESANPRGLIEYVEPERLIDVLQLDIRSWGFVDNAAMARRAAPAGALTIPHNWGSQFGGLMGLHIAKAVEAVPAAEDDRSTCDVLRLHGYEFRGGLYSVPASPGMSVTVDEDVYRHKYRAAEVVVV